jgi:seryl-tRNA synthetase
MTPELLKTEADNCDAQSGLSPAPLLGISDKHRKELELVNAEIAEVKIRLHNLSEKARAIRHRLRHAVEREAGNTDEERQKISNDKTRETASLHYADWSVKDELFLLENKHKMTYVEMAKHLGRTRKAIKGKIYQLKETVAAMPNEKS